MSAEALRREPHGYRQDPAVPSFPDDRPIVVFDGHCVLCSGFARFVLRHDRAAEFRLLAAQSPLGQALYRHYGLDPDEFTTNLVIEDGRLYTKLDGSLRVLRRLGAPWSWANALRLLPAAFQGRLYDAIARNRYRLLGRREACFVPAPADRARFLA